MKRNQQDQLEWLTFDLFSECSRLLHGVFLRQGGVSSGAFNSLNFGVTQGDSETKVAINHKRALEALNLSQCYNLYQCHSNCILEAPLRDGEKGDALITSQPKIGLLMLHADCQAAIFYDPIRHVVANVHCGWRGNVQNIYESTVKRMQKQYHSSPKDLLVGISPSLGPMKAEFRHFRRELPKKFWPFQVKPTYFDLWEISRWQLTECGVLDHHIEIARMCTFSNPKDFFSYRRVKVSGRHGTFAALS